MSDPVSLLETVQVSVDSLPQPGNIEGDALLVIGFGIILSIIALREVFRRISGRFGGLRSSGSESSEDDFTVEDTTVEDTTVEESDEDVDDPEEVDDGLHLDTEFKDILGDDRTKTVEEILGEGEELSPDQIKQAREILPPHLRDEQDIDPEDLLSKVERLHQRQIAPNRVEKGATEYKVGDLYRRVLFAHSHPDETQIGGIKAMVDDPTIHFEAKINFHAMDGDRALRKSKNLYRNLESSINVDAENSDALSLGEKAVRRKKARTFYDQIDQNGEGAVNTTMYVVARDRDPEHLRDKVDILRNQFRTEADIHLKTVERNQKAALISASPIGIDKLHRDIPDLDPSHPMLGSSVGAIIASLSQSQMFEPAGHQWGEHAVQGNPIVKDPFNSPRNYNMVVVGESGSGKSLATKYMALSTKAVKEDTLIIILDPLQGFMGLAEALDAEKVTIGGKQNLNPMEIRKPSEEHIESEAFDEERDPLSAKIDDVMAFIQNFVAQQPGTMKMGEETQLLRSIVLESYKQKGITHDVQTHDNPSPTLTDVLELAGHAAEDPQKWAEGPQDPSDIEEQASKIGTILREFAPGGQYHNLAQETEGNVFGDNDVIYLDLSQQEASGGGGVGVVGQLMFSLAYEKCKQYPGPALYIVDEARFLFREADTLEYLVQRVRHSRHYDTSIRFITQEMDDFFDFEGAESIVSNSSFQMIFQSPNVENWGHKFDLNEQHMAFVKNAATGSKRPFSQALVRFPEKDQYFPLTIRLNESMLAVADFNEQEDRYDDLPGRGDIIERSPIARELVARIRRGAHSHEEAMDKLLDDWEDPIWKMLDDDRAANALSRIQSGENPRSAVYSEALGQVHELIQTTGGDEVANEVVDRIRQAIIETYRNPPEADTPDSAPSDEGKSVELPKDIEVDEGSETNQQSNEDDGDGQRAVTDGSGWDDLEASAQEDADD